MTTSEYDAFISYSHAADGHTAPALRRGLQDFARPWYRRRTMRVFLDQTSLALNPQLWSTILTVLERSRTLILLACPESAGSQWVGMEARWWLQNRSSRQLLIVLSDGEIEWDPAARDFDWSRTTALPRELAGAFEEEPLYLDMRWTREADLALSRDPRLQEALAQLYAAITGRDKDELIGEDLRRHRQMLRTAWGAAAMLGAAALAAIVAAGLFLQQRDLARERELEARHHFYAAQLKQAQIAAASGDMVQVADLLATQIPAPGQPDLRSFAWTMLWHASHRELASVAAPVQSQLAFSRDGSRLSVSGVVTGAADTTGGRLREYSVPEGRLLGERILLHRPAAMAGPLADGTLIVAPRLVGPETLGGAALLWLPAGGEPRNGPRLPGSYAAAATSPHGEAVALSRLLPQADLASSVELWWPREGRRTQLAAGLHGWARALAFSPDGSELALVVDDAAQNDRPARVQIRALPSGSLRLERELDSSAAMSLVWSRDGQHLFVGDVRGELQRLAREDGRTVARLTAHDGMVLALAVSPDGRLLASGGMDRRVKLWRTADGRALGGLPLMRGAIEALEFAPDGRVLVATGGGELKLWDMASESGLGQVPGQARPVDGPKLVGLAFSPDSATVAAIGSGGGIGLYDVLGMRQRRHLELQPGDLGARTLSYSPSGRLLAAAGDGGVRVWRTESGELLLDRELVVEDLVFAAEDELILATDGGLVSVDPATRATKRVSRLRPEVMAYSPALKLLALARSSDGPARAEVRLWDLLRGREICRLEGHRQGLLALAFSPDGDVLASAGYDGELLLWNPKACRQVHHLPPRRGAIQALAFSPDGRTLAVASEAEGASRGAVVDLVDTFTWEKLLSLPTGTAWAHSLAFSPDGLALAIGADNQAVTGSASLRIVRGAWPRSDAVAIR